MKTNFSYYSSCTIKWTIVLFLIISSSQYCVAHWNSKGPFGGTVTCLLAVDTNMYIGTDGGGVFKSASSRILSWKAVNPGLGSGNISALTYLSVNIIAGTADSGIFISHDHGGTWSSSNSGLGSKNVRSLYVVENTIYAGTDKGVFISTDSGLSWHPQNGALQNFVVTIFISYGTKIFAGTDLGGVFVKENGGDTWSAVNDGMGNLHVLSLFIFNNTLVASTPEEIFSTDVNTLSWLGSGSGLEHAQVYSFCYAGGVLYAGTEKGIYTSASDGITWTKPDAGLNDTVKALAVSGNLLIAGTQRNGVYTCTVSSGSWNSRNLNFNSVKTYALCASGSLIIGATEQGVYVSKDLAANYIASNKGLDDSTHVSSLLLDGSSLYACTKFGGVYLSKDTGRNWSAVNTGLTDLDIFKLINKETRIFAATENGFVFSMVKNTGIWVSESGNLPADLHFTALASNGNVVFAGTSGKGIFKYSDQNSWEPFNSGLPDLPVTSLAILGSNLFAGTSGAGVLISDLASPGWVPSNAGLPTLEVLSLNITDNLLLTGYRGGVYVSSDQGASWKSPAVLLNIPPYAEVRNIAFSTDRVFITTDNNSIYSNAKSELPGYVAGIDQFSILKGSGIDIFPNPNNGDFAIHLSRDNDQIKEVKMYDSKGELMDVFDQPSDVIHVHYAKGLYNARVRLADDLILSQKVLIE